MSAKGSSKSGPPPVPQAAKASGKASGKSGGYLALAAERRASKAPEPEPAPTASLRTDPLLECPPSRRFEVGDPEALRHLEDLGYVVLSAVASPGELEEAERLLFEFMGEHAGWRRGAPETWSDEGLARVAANGIANGLVNKRGAGNSDLSWYVRTLPQVQAVFRQVWGTPDLITSFDGFGVFRPWHTGRYCRTLGGWFHVDQGQPGRQCVQGLLSLYDQDAATGGLTVIPGSHLRFEEHGVHGTDYVEVGEDSPVCQQPRHLVQMQAGDLVLWDSRTVHCSSPAMEMPTVPEERLLRAVVYVCMTPRSFASEAVLAQRVESYNLSRTTSHWPHKNVNGFGFKREPPLQYDAAPPERKSLI